MFVSATVKEPRTSPHPVCVNDVASLPSRHQTSGGAVISLFVQPVTVTARRLTGSESHSGCALNSLVLTCCQVKLSSMSCHFI